MAGSVGEAGHGVRRGGHHHRLGDDLEPEIIHIAPGINSPCGFAGQRDLRRRRSRVAVVVIFGRQPRRVGGGRRCPLSVCAGRVSVVVPNAIAFGRQPQRVGTGRRARGSDADVVRSLRQAALDAEVVATAAVIVRCHHAAFAVLQRSRRVQAAGRVDGHVAGARLARDGNHVPSWRRGAGERREAGGVAVGVAGDGGVGRIRPLQRDLTVAHRGGETGRGGGLRVRRERQDGEQKEKGLGFADALGALGRGRRWPLAFSYATSGGGGTSAASRAREAVVCVGFISKLAPQAMPDDQRSVTPKSACGQKNFRKRRGTPSSQLPGSAQAAVP